MSAVRCEVVDGVATITLDSPETRNVLNAASLPPLREHLADAAADDAVRVVVLTGEGGTFCAGADLAGASSDAEGFAGSGPQALVGVLEAMLDHPKPIVARVQGHVAGGGNGLVAAADLAVAVDTARFAFSEVRVGVAPAVISVVCLARMSPSHARELMLTGERVSAQRVLEAGLLTAVADAEGFDALVRSYVDQLLLGGPQALARTKELLRRVPTMPRDEAFAWTAEVSAGHFSSDEAREGMTAFFERRRPSWAPPEQS
ncbi:MAG: enoyl-CoA hydratase-related protein [Candidatus Nanopelagicales bacterium]